MIKEGDLFLLISDTQGRKRDRQRRHLLTYKKDGSFFTHHGKIEYSQITDFGDIILSHRSYPYIVARPTVSDLAKQLKRKTSIMYAKDIGYLMLNTSISSDSTIIECGAGSGGLSTSLASFLSDKGKLLIFERRKEFLELSKANLIKYNLADKATYFECDPSEAGFGIVDADAAFIDVPEPWTLIAPAWDALKSGSYLVSLSPQVEQVRKTVDAMNETGFMHVKTVELLEREILVKPVGIRPKATMQSHTGYLTVAMKLSKKTLSVVEQQINSSSSVPETNIGSNSKQDKIESDSSDEA